MLAARQMTGMPPEGADLVQIVIGRSRRVVFDTELVVINYGATVPVGRLAR